MEKSKELGKTSVDFDELRRIAKNAKRYVLICNNAECTENFLSNSTSWCLNDEYDWLVDMVCRNCNKQWSICLECANVKTAFTTENQIKQHRYTYHNPKRPSKRKVGRGYQKEARVSEPAEGVSVRENVRNNSTLLCPLECNVAAENCFEFVAADAELTTNSIDVDVAGSPEFVSDDADHNNLDEYNLLDDSSIHKCNKKTSTFYSYALNACGKKYLIANMCGSTTDLFGKISPDEVNYQMKLSRFVSTLTISQQRQFAALLNNFKHVYLTQSSDCFTPVCKIPKQLADLRRMYTEGEDSIENHLPIPDCVMLDDHSYVSITDCIADVLLRNQSDITTVDEWTVLLSQKTKADNYDIFYSKRVLDIVADARTRIAEVDVEHNLTIVPIFITLWSDDFDPNRSIKANRQSVWIKTCTLFFRSKDGKYIERTYPVSMSKKGQNHETVEYHIKEELGLLNSGNFVSLFSMFHRKPVPVHADIFCVMNDQPERRGNLSLSGGNSIAHGRFGITLDCRQKQTVIRSCDMCSNSIASEVDDVVERRSIAMYEWRIGSCDTCTAWMYNLHSNLLFYCPDKDYPEFRTSPNGKIKPKIITRSMLELSITHVHNGIGRGILNNAKSKSILKYSGWNSASQDLIIECANNCKQLKHINNNKESDPEAYAIMQEEVRDDPTKYKMYTLPSAWYHLIDLSTHVDVPMHLLMLGIVKSVMLRIGIWLRFRSQKTLFIGMAKTKLLTIKTMNIEWCKILEYPVTDKFGGWVSENFLAMTRLSNWFYSLLYYLPDALTYFDPVTPHEKWTKKENERWLEARGLSKDGKAGDLRNRVAKYFAENKVPPIIVKNDCTKSHILEMIGSMSLMIHMIMTYDAEKYTVSDFEATIRLFLIKYDVVDTGLSDKDIPSWISQYNFLCLLNLPDTIRNYGHVRNLWEGGTNGEGYLKRVKNVLKPGLINQWQKWSVTTLLKEQLYSEWNEDMKSDDQNFLLAIRKECRVYSNRNHAQKEIDSGKPFSAVMINGNIYVCYRNTQKIKGMKVILTNETPTWNGILYHTLRIANGHFDINDAHGLVGLILLPKLNVGEFDSKSDSTEYCFIKSDWT
jgi:hypothetical protein